LDFLGGFSFSKQTERTPRRMRECKKCKQIKKVKDFILDTEPKNVYHIWCNECREKEEEPKEPDWRDISF
jgi:hypothetical protein